MAEKPASTSGDWRADKRASIDEVFAGAKRGATTAHESPSGRYRLDVVAWSPSSGWAYTEGVVRAGAASELISTVRRNYPAFPFTWCKDHPNGHDYLLCGEDYQGQTIIELDTGRRVDYLAAEAEQGVGFCWAKHHLAPKKNILVVDGCYWACPYELVAFDFSQPLALPYAELYRWSGDLAEVVGFDSHGTLTWTFEREVRLSDGKPYDDLTESENAELLDGNGAYLPGLLGAVSYRASWSADQPFETTVVVLTGTD